MGLDHKEWLRGRLDSRRYDHSVAVSTRAAFLAGINGENCDRARLAGLLHDCCKCLSHSEQLKIIESHGIILDDFERAQPQIWHAPAGAITVAETFHISDAEVLSSIRLHTTGAKNMTRLEKIIYISDLTSDDREFSDVAEVRELSEKNLDAAMRYCLAYIVRMLVDTQRPIVRDTWEAYNFFLSL